MSKLYPRGQEEFSRVLAFSDGVYAIAMTLLVLSIGLPRLAVEVAMVARAHHNEPLETPLTEEVYRWQRAAASSPFFLISLPVAFVSPTLACLRWFGAVPYQALYLNCRAPAGADSLG